ncbi:hypothetical protein GCM10028790_09830 [Micromonospora taraxaci]
MALPGPLSRVADRPDGGNREQHMDLNDNLGEGRRRVAVQVMGGGATPRAASLQGRTDPGSSCPGGCSGNPGPPWGAQQDRP